MFLIFQKNYQTSNSITQRLGAKYAPCKPISKLPCNRCGASATPRWLLVEGSVLPACVDTARARDMGNANRRRWWLLPADATVQCR